MKRLGVLCLAAVLLLSGCKFISKKQPSVTTTVTEDPFVTTVEDTALTTEPVTTVTEETTTEELITTTTTVLTLPRRTVATTRRTTTVATTTKTTAMVTVNPAEIGEYMTMLINRERAARGVEPLTFRSDLQEYADIRASEIKEYFSHTRPNGSDCFTVFDDCPATFWAMGENIAMGQQTVVEVMDAWMDSSGHRQNILSSDFNGVAIAFNDYYWVQLFVCE